MPTPSDFGDGATVIEGPTPSTHAYAHSPGGSSSRGKGAAASKRYPTFAKTPDYFSEERPFVVLIGKKGVTGALQELDGHLRTVRSFLFLTLTLTLTLRLRCSQADINIFCVGRQAGYNKILSDKVCDCSEGEGEGWLMWFLFLCA
jgi:hypothetical protein